MGGRLKRGKQTLEDPFPEAGVSDEETPARAG